MLVVAPFSSVAIALTLQQPSTQSEETHEESEHKKLDSRAQHATSKLRPARKHVQPVRRAVPQIQIWLPSSPPSIDPAKYSERRLR
jgi:hypothetical protein